MSADNFVELREISGLWYWRQFRLSQCEQGPEDNQEWLKEGEDLFDGRSFPDEDKAIEALEALQDSGFVIEY